MAKQTTSLASKFAEFAEPAAVAGVGLVLVIAAENLAGAGSAVALGYGFGVGSFYKDQILGCLDTVAEFLPNLRIG